MADKKVRIDEYLLDKIKKFRSSKKDNSVKFPSDKHFIHMAVLNLLKEENEKKDEN